MRMGIKDHLGVIDSKTLEEIEDRSAHKRQFNRSYGCCLLLLVQYGRHMMLQLKMQQLSRQADTIYQVRLTLKGGYDEEATLYSLLLCYPIPFHLSSSIHHDESKWS